MNLLSKRLLSLALALVMIVSLIPAAAAYSNVSGWAEPEVAAMDELGLIPDSLADANMGKNISRLDMARIAVLAYEKITGEALGLPENHPFTDTTDPDAEKAYAVGLVKGDGDGTFRPDDSLTRLEFFAIVGQFLETLDYPITDSNYADLSRFSDASSIPAWGVSYTRLTVGLGIVNGTGSELDWPSAATREESICLFYRTYLVAVDADLPEDTTPGETTPTEPEYTGDFINLSFWAEDAVNAMDELGLIPSEVKASAMDGTITRQNLCKIIMRTYKLMMGITDGDLGTPDDPFSDTHDIDVRNAYRLGIVNGVGGGKFAPNDPITRQDFFKMSVNFLNAIGYPYTDDDTVDLSEFKDAGKVSDYALGPTRLLVGIGVVNGDDNKLLNPRDAIVCQEALVIFHRIYQFVNTWVAPEETPDERPDENVQAATSVVEFALQFECYPYVYGGKSPEDGFDCSGFVYYVYKQFGYTLYPGATNQWNTLSGTVIPREDLRPGDLVFFSNNGDVSGMTHVGLYIGNGQMIHASNPTKGVIITDLSEPYYVRMYLGAKRVIE